MGMRAGGVGTEDTLALTVTLPQTERGPRSEADHELFLERTSRALVMLKYEGRSHSLLPSLRPRPPKDLGFIMSSKVLIQSFFIST